MGNRINITECFLREDIQNIKENDLHLFPPELLIDIYKNLKSAGEKSFEIASMVNPKFVPSMHPDRLKKIIKGVGPANANLELITLVPNLRGVDNFFKMGLGQNGYKHTAGIFFSPYDDVNKKNLGQNGTLDKLLKKNGEYDKMFSHFRKNNTPTVAYIMNALGHKVKGQIHQPTTNELVYYINYLTNQGVKRISLAGTEGLRDRKTTTKILTEIVSKIKNPSVLAYHVHNKHKKQATQNIIGAYEAGIRHYDTSAGMHGGCIINNPISNAGTKEAIVGLKKHDPNAILNINLNKLNLQIKKIHHAYR